MYCPQLTEPNWLKESSGGSVHPLHTPRNNPIPQVRGSTFSAQQNTRAASYISPFPGPSFNFWLFLWSVLYDDQAIPHKQLLLKANRGVPTPHRSPPLVCTTTSSSHLPASSQHSRRPLGQPPSPLSPPIPHETRSGLCYPQAFLPVEAACAPPPQGPRAGQGCTSAYLLAEEEALGGENCEAVGGRALGRAVSTGCLADFSLLLLAQTEESVRGRTGRASRIWACLTSTQLTGLARSTQEKTANYIASAPQFFSKWGLHTYFEVQGFYEKC